MADGGGLEGNRDGAVHVGELGGTEGSLEVLTEAEVRRGLVNVALSDGLKDVPELRIDVS